MKKKFELVKSLQLILFFAVTAVGLAVIFTDSELYQMVGRNRSVRILCILLWVTMAMSFLFIFWDFTTHNSFKKDYRELDYAVYNDRLSGIANRYSCDALIEKYADTEIPPKIGCVMIDIGNIRDINERYGHLKGNRIIREFSDMLHIASLGLCFVGRNGGNKFMALFEDCTPEQMSTFLTRVNEKVELHNSNPNEARIEYGTGSSFSGEDTVKEITSLISLADRRLSAKNDSLTGFSNRASCDDIIGLYTDAELPEGFGCVMIDIGNIRDINETAGHAAGNHAIKTLGDILRECARSRCFVGRNGGTKFLALFEKGGEEAVSAFIGLVKDKLKQANSSDAEYILDCRIGASTLEKDGEAEVHKLVALADRRLRENI